MPLSGRTRVLLESGPSAPHQESIASGVVVCSRESGKPGSARLLVDDLCHHVRLWGKKMPQALSHSQTCDLLCIHLKCSHWV